jgi:hypothetical protein
MINSDSLFTKKINVYIRNNDIIIKSKQKNKAFLIDKNSGKAEASKYHNSTNLSQELLIQAHGILGIIHAEKADYLIVIESASFIGCIIKSEIYIVKEVMFIPMIQAVSTVVFKEDREYTMMYKDFLKRNNLYFSETFDVTNSVKGFYEKISNNTLTKTL